MGRLLALLFVAGCASAPERPECSQAELGKLEGAYVAEATLACQGFTYDDCPALPEIRERYARWRKAWVACR